MSYHIFGKDSEPSCPAFSKPYTDESISSWLTRISFDHGLNRSSLLRLITADQKNFQGDWGIDRVFKGPKIHTLASHTNCTVDEILETTLMSFNGKLFQACAHIGIPSIWTVKDYQQVSLLSPDAKTNTLFCPSCFAKKENPVYYKKQWRLTVSFVCTDCGCYLKNRCPHCKRASSGMNTPDASARTIDEYFLQCSNCYNDVSACVPQQADEHICQLQLRINICLKNGYSETGHLSVEYFKVLRKLVALLLRKRQRGNLNAFVKYVYAFHDVTDFNPRLYNLDVARLPLKYQAELFNMACWLLDEWPNRFLDLCQHYHVSSADIMYGMGQTPLWFEAEIRSGLDMYNDTKWRARKKYRYQRDPDFDITLIKCDIRSDYDYDPDEAYYAEQKYNFVGELRILSLKKAITATTRYHK